VAYAYYERLSALDASFLALEDASSHMHIGGVALFDAAPLRTPAGGVDFEQIRTVMEAGMHRIPRYRQRIARIPLIGHPIWIDDDRFNLRYHLRHTHLPLPGDERALKRLAGRIMSQQLDRGKPLWEMWVVEGVEGDRFAIITKVHHCMIDGVGSVELTGSVMRPTPDRDPRLDHPPARWIPRPAPSGRQLVADELGRRAMAQLAPLALVRDLLRNPRRTARGVVDAVEGVREALAGGLSPASPTPLNGDLGPHRRFDWAAMDLATVRAIKEKLGGTVNDVMLAVLSGALRYFLRQRGLDPGHLEFRAMLPVNVRTEADRESLGNRVAMVVARLPLDERDPCRRLERVIAETRACKGSKQALGMKTIEEVSDLSFAMLITEFSRLAAQARPFNVVVTNVPGPQFPVYVLSSRMLACYPLVPLFRNQGLGVALFSYDGRIYWGFNADWDAVPDLHDLVDAVDREFHELGAAAGLAAAPTAKPLVSAVG
jgi:diacylglycerol O-acyltransferase